MNFPAYEIKPVKVTKEMEDAIGTKVLEAYIDRDLMLVIKDENKIKNLKVDFEKIKNLKGTLLIVTTKSNNKKYDCISRAFAPKLGVDEDL